jgi:hypothetical protein
VVDTARRVVAREQSASGQIRAAALTGGGILAWTHDRRQLISQLLLHPTGAGADASTVLMRLTGGGQHLTVAGAPGSALAVAGGRGAWLIDSAAGAPVAFLPEGTVDLRDGLAGGWDPAGQRLRLRGVQLLGGGPAGVPDRVAPAVQAAVRRAWRNDRAQVVLRFDDDGRIAVADQRGLPVSRHPLAGKHWRTSGDLILVEPAPANDIAWFVPTADGTELRLNGEAAGPNAYRCAEGDR